MNDSTPTPEDNPLALLVLAPKKCKRVKRNGEPCGNWPRRDQTVCGFHGGSAPQNIAAANRRMGEAAPTIVEAALWAVDEARRTGDLMALVAATRNLLARIPGLGMNAVVGVTSALPREDRDWLPWCSADELEQLHAALESADHLYTTLAERAKVRQVGGEPKPGYSPSSGDGDVVDGYVLLPEGDDSDLEGEFPEGIKP